MVQEQDLESLVVQGMDLPVADLASFLGSLQVMVEGEGRVLVRLQCVDFLGCLLLLRLGWRRDLLARRAKGIDMCCVELGYQVVRQTNGDMDCDFWLKNVKNLPTVGLGATAGAVPGLYGTGGGAGF